MTTHPSQSGPGLDAIMSERRQLINLAYRLLGSLAEAEDVVQETYARWYAMSRPQQEAIESPGAWLTTVASRICLNLLGSARARRERYVGEWIPEPLPERTDGSAAGPAPPGRPGRPGHPRRVGQHGLPRRARIDDAGRAGRVHPARRLPATRSPRSAEIVGRTPAACRQLASSARRRIRAAQAPADPDRPARRDRPGLQTGLGGQGHRRPDRPARPRRHRDRRRRRPAPCLPAPDRGRRADRPRLDRDRRTGRRATRSWSARSTASPAWSLSRTASP